MSKSGEKATGTQKAKRVAKNDVVKMEALQEETKGIQLSEEEQRTIQRNRLEQSRDDEFVREYNELCKKFSRNLAIDPNSPIGMPQFMVQRLQ
ncbi:hypothetical protein BPT24_122 [Tenacibaculum phage pT24]|uniref:Uncharacterized protein n=1 Tax=Tenacibaculum phage pT24 TaxID=1880590 RepID=A0A1B4XWS2_9CAUD|nr:hypothetical protein HYP10_gp122 [Tenacibaculum phage pT24]BAV39247.1 hypothetical protein BPT24_122 [Tenacibaculum phage pT24]